MAKKKLELTQHDIAFVKALKAELKEKAEAYKLQKEGTAAQSIFILPPPIGYGFFTE